MGACYFNVNPVITEIFFSTGRLLGDSYRFHDLLIKLFCFGELFRKFVYINFL